MKGNSVHKIPGGKLVKVHLDFDRDTIVSVKIFGDFFMHPEEGIEKVEASLAGKKLVEKDLVQAISEAHDTHGLEFFGVTPEGLATAILMAKESALNA
ncbi:MAG: hypothetical protein HY392_00730 [Candidatus Diapherotrites archaeon]|nr:hypothetical protein [Candidatus Diapherotrites archaeon]